MGRIRIALYERLSKEDDGWKAESSSIAMQRMLLQKYAAEHFTDYELLEYSDDGYTGTNFNRPGVQELLELVKAFQIDCIMVKDFSRFSRDYIELGSYLEQIFPYMGVRFISVNDNYDSMNYKGSIADLDVSFKSLLYDLYSKDLSQKVKTSLAAVKAEGKYVSANAPFGYEKAPDDRHMLLVDEKEAEIVRKIYELALEGLSSTQIAKKFNLEGIKTPAEFKGNKREAERTPTPTPKDSRFLWNASYICQLLRNPIYTGDIAYGKTEKDCVGGRNHLKPREEWKIIYDHHEPIVSRKMFQLVQKVRGTRRNLRQGKANRQNRTMKQSGITSQSGITRQNKTMRETGIHPLTGKVVCGGCGRRLTYRKGKNPYFYCCSRYSNGLEGCISKVNGMFLEQVVLYKLQERSMSHQELKGYEDYALSKEMVDCYIDRVLVISEADIRIEWSSAKKVHALV